MRHFDLYIELIPAFIVVILVVTGVAGILWLVVRWYDSARDFPNRIAEESAEEVLFSIVCSASFDGLFLGTWAYPFVAFAFTREGLHIRALRGFRYVRWLVTYNNVTHHEFSRPFLFERLNVYTDQQSVPKAINLWIGQDDAAQIQAILTKYCRSTRETQEAREHTTK